MLAHIQVGLKYVLLAESLFWRSVSGDEEEEMLNDIMTWEIANRQKLLLFPSILTLKYTEDHGTNPAKHFWVNLLYFVSFKVS